MKIEKEYFVITSKDLPIRFEKETVDGELTDKLEEACFYEKQEDADFAIEEYYDEPDEFKTIPVKVTYEI